MSGHRKWADIRMSGGPESEARTDRYKRRLGQGLEKAINPRDLEAIKARAEIAVGLAKYGGRPEAAEEELRQIETHYATDVPALLAELERLRKVLATVSPTPRDG